MMAEPGKRIAVRLPLWLYEDVEASAEESGWDVSKQVRLELAAARGKARIPSLPNPDAPTLDFKGPTHGAPGPRRRRR